MRLEQLLLLAVRCLAVLLLVAALASVTPWAEAVWHWANPEGGVAVAGGGARRHKILVLDGSFSMAQRPGRHANAAPGEADEASCFEKARALAARIVRDSPGGDGFSVVLMAAPPRAVVSEPSEDARKVADEIQGLRVLHGNADLVATLNAVEGLWNRSPGKFEEKEVYFLTDRQRSLIHVTLVNECGAQGWLLHSCNVRTNHVHLVVSAARASTFIRSRLKALASKALSDAAGLSTAGTDGRKRWWTEKGNIVPIEDDKSLEEITTYVRELQ